MEDKLFSEWRREHGYKSRKYLYDVYVSKGMTQDEFDEMWYAIEAEFEEYCDELGLWPCMDE